MTGINGCSSHKKYVDGSVVEVKIKKKPKGQKEMKHMTIIEDEEGRELIGYDFEQ